MLYDPAKLSTFLADRKAKIAAREAAVNKPADKEPADKEKVADKAEKSEPKAEEPPKKFIVQLPVSQNFDVTLDSLLKAHSVAVTYDNTDYSSLIWNAAVARGDVRFDLLPVVDDEPLARPDVRRRGDWRHHQEPGPAVQQGNGPEDHVR